MKKSTVWALVILAVAVVLLVVWPKQNSVTNKEPIRIGFIGPLTGSLAAMGEEQKNTTEIATEEINKAGGIDGRTLEFVYEDGKCDGKEAATAAQKLINIEKLKIIMPVCSSESLAVAPLASENKVLVLAVWPTNPAFSGISDYTFRNSYSDEDTGRLMAETIAAKYQKVGVITELTDYPVGLLGAFKKYFSGSIYEEGYQPNSKDVRTQVTKIISQKPEAILVNPNSPDTGLAVLQQLAQQGYKKPIYGNFFGSSNAVLQSKEAQGMVFFSDPDVQEGELKKHLFSVYEERYGAKPNFEFAVAAQYDAVYILKKAIQSVGDNPSDLKNYLHQLRDFEGLLGVYGFDQRGDMVGAKPSAKQIIDGKVSLYQ